MTPAELDTALEVARALRDAMKHMQQENRFSFFAWDDLGGTCGVGAFALARLLRRRGLVATPVFGEFKESGDHCWVRLSNGAILDVTATQFADCGFLFPPVFHAEEHPSFVERFAGRKAAHAIRDWKVGRDVRRAVELAEKLLQERAILSATRSTSGPVEVSHVGI